VDQFKIIKRALETTWRYRALWLFGALVALTAGGRNGGGGGGSNVSLPGPESQFPGIDVPGPPVWLIFVVIGAIILLALIFGVLSAIVRYVSGNALIQMVNEREETGTEVGIKRGFRMGWSRAAWRFFLIDLVLYLPAISLFIVGLLISAAPLLLWVTRRQVLGIVGTVVTIGLFFLLLLISIGASIVLNLLRHFFLRQAALEDAPVFNAIKEGFGLVRRHLGDVALMGLLMFGLGIVYTVVTLPVFVLLLIAALIAGGSAGVLVGGLASLVFQGAVPWIVGGLTALPLFIIIVGLPGLFISGVYEVFKSTSWTLTFRELTALDAVLMAEKKEEEEKETAAAKEKDQEDDREM